jgi:hypothetical protein
MTTSGTGTRDDPWVLETPPRSSGFTAFRDEELDPPALVVRVGKTELRYALRCIDDLHAMLRAAGDWVPLGAADEQKPAADGTVEAGGAPRRTPSAAGTASRRACADASASTSRPCSRPWASRRSSTTRATTACAPPDSSARMTRGVASGAWGGSRRRRRRRRGFGYGAPRLAARKVPESP